jgi:Flp pilus assembly secretin CpaC
MKTARIALISVWFLTSATASETPDLETHRPPVVITQGEQRLIHLPGLKRYALGSPILRAIPAPGRAKDTLLLKAVKPGITDLWIWKTDGSTEHRPIEVRAWKAGLTNDLDRRLNDLREVEVWIVGDPGKSKASYLVHGTVSTEREAKVLGKLLESFPAEIESRVSLSDSLYRKGEAALRKWFSTSSKKDDLELETDPSARRIVIRGGLADPKSRAAVERSIRSAFPLAELEIDALPDRNPTIHFKVFLLELRKNKTRTLGVDYPGLIPNALRISSLGIHTALSIEAAIHAMETDGSARVLSQPELVVRAPGEAELFAGGEIPIQSKTVYSSRVEWRSYGLSLKLKVQAASGRRVRVDVQTEVSHLDPKIGADAIPGLQANRMKTQVDATFGKPLFLSGLLQEGVKKAARGLPFLKDIPVLGTLFGSREYLEDRSELVAILLPSRNVPEPPRIAAGIDRPTGAVPLPRNWLSPEEEMNLRASPDFPWNAFGGPLPPRGTVDSEPDEALAALPIESDFDAPDISPPGFSP